MNGVHRFQLPVEAKGDVTRWPLGESALNDAKKRKRAEFIKRTRSGSCTFTWISSESGLFLFTPFVFVMEDSVASFYGVTAPPITYHNRPRFTLAEVLAAASTGESLPLIAAIHESMWRELDKTGDVGNASFKSEFTGSMAIKAIEESAVIELSHQLTKEEYESAIAAL